MPKSSENKKYKLVALTDEAIIKDSYGEVMNAGDYNLKGIWTIKGRREFAKSRAISGGLYDPAIFGMEKFCKCQRTRVTEPNKIEKCPTCGIPVGADESSLEKIYGHYILPHAYINPVMTGNLVSKLKARGWYVPIEGSAASPYDLLKSICFYSYSGGKPEPITEDTDVNTIGLDGLYNLDPDFRSTLSKVLVVPSTVYRPCYPKRNKDTGDVELVMAGDTRLGTWLSGVINFCEEVKKRDVTNISVMDYAILEFNFVWMMYLYHAGSPILQGGKYHSTRDLTRSTIESSIRATISPLLDSDLNKIRLPKGLAYHALDENIKDKLMKDYGYTASEALNEIRENTSLANDVFMDIINNETICLFWRNPTLYKNSVVAMYPEVWDEPCLTPDTEIEFYNGERHTLLEIYNWNMIGAEVISRDENGNRVPGTIDRVYKVPNKSELLYEIELENGEVIKCTKHHKLMLKDGTYKEAQYLTVEDELMDIM